MKNPIIIQVVSIDKLPEVRFMVDGQDITTGPLAGDKLYYAIRAMRETADRLSSFHATTKEDMEFPKKEEKAEEKKIDAYPLYVGAIAVAAILAEFGLHFIGLGVIGIVCFSWIHAFACYLNSPCDDDATSKTD